jgi:hypothetical protein
MSSQGLHACRMEGNTMRSCIAAVLVIWRRLKGMVITHWRGVGCALTDEAWPAESDKP